MARKKKEFATLFHAPRAEGGAGATLRAGDMAFLLLLLLLLLLGS